MYSEKDLAWQKLSAKLSKDLRKDKPHITLKTFQAIHELDVSLYISLAVIGGLIFEAPLQCAEVLPWALEHYPVSPDTASSLLNVAISQKNTNAVKVLLDHGYKLEFLNKKDQENLRYILAKELGKGVSLYTHELDPNLFVRQEDASKLINEPMTDFLVSLISEKGLIDINPLAPKKETTWGKIYEQFAWPEASQIRPVFLEKFCHVFFSNEKTGMLGLKRFHPDAMKYVKQWEEIGWLNMQEVHQKIIEMHQQRKMDIHPVDQWFSQWEKHQLADQTPISPIIKRPGSRL